jgi:predicted flap endonuclease-1-like 5' DNA nuclease
LVFEKELVRMTILLLQTFLLTLGAFLLGATLACFIRRGFSGQVEAPTGPAFAPSVAAAATASAPVAAPKAADTDRFGRALAGGQGPAVPPVFQGQPVVEVQPLPAAPVARAPVSEPTPPPVAAAAPERKPAPEPEPLTTPPVGPSYTEVAVAAAAVAAAAAAKAEAEEAEAAARAAEEAEAAEAAARAAEEALALEEARALDEARAIEEARALEEATALEEARALAEAKALEDAKAAEEALAAEEAARAAEQAQLETEEAASTLQAPELSELPPDQPYLGEAVDDLTRIRGIDGDLKERLVRLGVGSFAAIAAWTSSDVNLISQSLGLQGRIEQENWIEQAQILAKGGDTNYSREFEAEAAPDAPALVDGERLHRIIGVDPQSETLLRNNGVTTLSQIAGWSRDDVERFEWLLGIQGRIARENWVRQAGILAGFVAVADDAADASQASAEAAVPVVEEPVEDSELAAAVAEPVELLPEEPEASDALDAPSRADYAGLRSVRSEALRGGSGLSIGGAGGIEDLKRIRGIGVLIEKKLHSLGITTYEQVANWTVADIDRISQLLDFRGRIERENWIEQARILASGGQTEFSRRADRGEA